MKHVVITGGSRGIGLALARAFLELGCRVTVAGRTEGSTRAALDHLLRVVPERGGALSAHACDVTEVEQLQALWSHAASLAPVDLWINNAGVSAKLAPLWNLSAAELQTVIDTNVRGVLLGSWVAMRGMRTQNAGAIYNLEGFGADGSTFPGTLAYATSKRAVAYLSKALSREASGSAVRVCTIDPGAVRTEMVATTWGGLAETNRLMSVMIDSLAIEADACARLLAPRVLENQRSGVRIRPWNELVAWSRALLLPLWALARNVVPRTPPSPAP